MDFNADHKCDLCGRALGECSDETGDHKCDTCGASLTALCQDSDKNHECDTCGSSLTYKYVVVIGVDGAGAFFKDANTPNLDRIYATGAVSYDVLTETPSISAQCWGSILHGVKCGVHGRTNTNTGAEHFPEDSKIPSFLKVIRDNDPDAELASFTNWANISYGIVEEGIGVYKPFNDPAVVTTKDSEVTESILAYLETTTPTAMFVQFDEGDGAGHGAGYGSQRHLDKISELDGYIGRIYDAYAAKGILDETLFIVTSDHGGTPDKNGEVGGSHGGDSDAEMYVMFAAAGKTVQAGTIGDMEIRDTAAVVLYALGYEQPKTWTAVVPSGIFGGVEAPEERPVYVDTESERYHETEATPSPDSEGYVTNFVSKPLVHYFPLDGNANDTVGNLTSVAHDKIYWINSYYGKGATLDDGYISLPDFSFGEDSWTISLWVDTRGVNPDPVILGNKNWGWGGNAGFVLCINANGQLVFNAGDGSSRYDYAIDLPENYKEGWVHVLFSINKDTNKVRLAVDFGKMQQVTVSASIMNAIYNAVGLNIGQDITGNYYPLSATVDELMFFRGVFDPEDVVALASYYGKDVSESEDPDFVPSIKNHPNADTPKEGDEGYIDNYISKYIGKDLIVYLPFDGDASAVTGQTTTASDGLSYETGFFGEAVRLKDGKYVAVDGVTLDENSKTFSFWYKTEEIATDDPVILAGKKWSGASAGFILATNTWGKFHFNIGNGSSRFDADPLMPTNFADGWMHVIIVVDKENEVVKVYFDFEEQYSKQIPEAMLSQVLSAVNKLYIGNDSSGRYSDQVLDAAMDELMIFDGALDANAVRALAKYYGVEEYVYGDVGELPEVVPPAVPEEPEVPDEPIVPDEPTHTVRDPKDMETPADGSDGHISNFVDRDLVVYMPFDESQNVILPDGATLTKPNGETYTDGVFSEAADIVGNNYQAIDGIELGAGSYSFAFWIYLPEWQVGDPVVLATKDWQNGAAAGFLITAKAWNGTTPQMVAVFADGSNRLNCTVNLTNDQFGGWMHVTVVVDKENAKLDMYFDFEKVNTWTIPEVLLTQTITDANNRLCIGQDVDKNYSNKLNADLDELMIFDGALTAEEVRALSAYYELEDIVF